VGDQTAIEVTLDAWAPESPGDESKDEQQAEQPGANIATEIRDPYAPLGKEEFEVLSARIIAARKKISEGLAEAVNFQPGDLGSFYYAFGRGFVVGLKDFIPGIVNGLDTAGSFFGEKLTYYTTYNLGWISERYFGFDLIDRGSRQQAFDYVFKDLARLEQAQEFLETVGTVIGEDQADVFYALVKGDVAAHSRTQYRRLAAMTITMELVAEFAAHLGEMDAEEKGELLGKYAASVFLEIVLLIVTGGSGSPTTISSRIATKASDLAGDLGTAAKSRMGEAMVRAIESVKSMAQTGRLAPKGGLPRGFFSLDEFGNFGSALGKRLKAAGYDDVQAVIQGSAATGVRARSKVGIPSGTPFDIIKQSDFDVALVSPKMFAKAKELGIPLRGGKTRTAPLRRGNLHQFDIADLPDSLLRTLYKGDGRQINFMIFESMEEALKRGASVGVPGL